MKNSFRAAISASGLGLALLLLSVAIVPTAQANPTEEKIAAFPEAFPYRAFDTKDAQGRPTRFYLSDAAINDERPLIIVLQGSGCSSNFFQREGRVSQGWHTFVRRAAGDRAQVLVVEKPGVTLFDRPANPGSAENCSPAFRREFTAERWLDALSAAVNAVSELRGRAPRAVMALGHSEGGVYAPRLAVKLASVTHAASLAAVPMSQLHDFFEMAASESGFIAKAPGTKADHIKRVLSAWKAVSDDPNSDERMVFGHAHRYWRDKFAPFDFASLGATRAKFFIAQGEADQNTSTRVTDAFAIELLTRGRDLTWLRIPGAGHSFDRSGEPAGAGMPAVVADAVAWFLGEPLVNKTNLIWPL